MNKEVKFYFYYVSGDMAFANNMQICLIIYHFSVEIAIRRIKISDVEMYQQPLPLFLFTDTEHNEALRNILTSYIKLKYLS